MLSITLSPGLIAMVASSTYTPSASFLTLGTALIVSSDTRLWWHIFGVSRSRPESAATSCSICVPRSCVMDGVRQSSAGYVKIRSANPGRTDRAASTEGAIERCSTSTASIHDDLSGHFFTPEMKQAETNANIATTSDCAL